MRAIRLLLGFVLAVSVVTMQRPAQAADKVSVVATFSILADFVRNVGIDSELEAQGPDDPLTVMVPEDSLDDAKDAIEALTEPDELLGES